MSVIDQLQAAAEALNEGDPEPFASLLAEDSEWRGISRGHLWWKQTPACHGPAEALEVMRHQIRKRADDRLRVRPEFTQVGDDRIIGSSEWTGTDGRRQVRYPGADARARQDRGHAGLCSHAARPSASPAARSPAAIMHASAGSSGW